MKNINLNDVQVNFLINALEHAGDRIWDDPSAYGFEEEDWEDNEEEMEKQIEGFKNEVCDKVLKQLKK